MRVRKAYARRTPIAAARGHVEAPMVVVRVDAHGGRRTTATLAAHFDAAVMEDGDDPVFCLLLAGQGRRRLCVHGPNSAQLLQTSLLHSRLLSLAAAWQKKRNEAGRVHASDMTQNTVWFCRHAIFRPLSVFFCTTRVSRPLRAAPRVRYPTPPSSTQHSVFRAGHPDVALLHDTVYRRLLLIRELKGPCVWNVHVCAWLVEENMLNPNVF